MAVAPSLGYKGEMIIQNTRDEIVPAELERITSHHKHPKIIEQQATATHQQPEHQQPHESPVFSISTCDTLVTLVTSKCHKGLGAVWLCVTRDNFPKYKCVTRGSK